jgi:hypothetical protein
VKWKALLGASLLIFTLTARAHEARCEDPLLATTSIYARLIDLGLERGWITPEQLEQAVDRDARVLKISESDALTFSLAKALNEQVDRMTSEDLQQAFRILRERQNRTRDDLKQEARAEVILAPQEIDQFDVKVPFAFRQKSKLFFIPREGKMPLIVLKTTRHTKVIDPLLHNESDPGTTSEFSSDNTIATPDGRLLFTFTKPAGGYQVWVKDLLDPDFSRPLHNGYPLPHQWHRTADGRVFLIETNDLQGRDVAVFEYANNGFKKIFSRTMKFVDFLSNEKGDLRVLGKVGTSTYVLYDPISKKRLWEWRIPPTAINLQPFLSREGITYLRTIDSKKTKFPNSFICLSYHHFFFKEGEREPVTVRKADSQKSQWHQLRDGRVVYPLSAFEGDRGQLADFSLIEPFPEQVSETLTVKSFWRGLFGKRSVRVWDAGLKSTLPAEAQWTADDEYHFEKDGAFFIYRWENNRMVLKTRIDLSFSPTQVHEFADLQTSDDKLFLALDYHHAALARSSSGTLPSTAIQPGIFSDVLVDRKAGQTYAAVAEHPTESVFRIHLYRLYGPREPR